MRIVAMLIAAASMAVWAQPPDPAELGRKAEAAGKRNDEKSAQYAYREYKVSYELDKNGKESNRETETWDVIGLEGSTYRKLIQKNDKPLPPKEQKKEDQRLAKETEIRKKETPEQRRNRLMSFSYGIHLSPELANKLYDCGYVSDEPVSGRLTHVLSCTAKPGIKPADDNEKELLSYQVKFWIDVEDFNHARIQMEMVGTNSRMKPGSVFDVTSFRNDAGVWLAQSSRIKFDVKFFKMIGAKGVIETTFSDYKRFEVESRVVDAQ